MDTTPKIIIKDNYGIDETGKLNSVTIPATVDTIQGPAEVTTYATTVNWVPNSSIIKCPNVDTFSVRMPWGVVSKIYLDNCKTIDNRITSSTTTYNSGMFSYCTSLSTVYMPKVETITTTLIKRADIGFSNCGVFGRCSSLTEIDLPSLTAINENNDGWRNSENGTFNYCANLTKVNMPKLNRIYCYDNNGTFRNCTGLSQVRFGSKGNPVSSLSSFTFYGCTQSNLIITIRVTDTSQQLAGQPWGANGSTVNYIGVNDPEDAEDRIFNPQNYT